MNILRTVFRTCTLCEAMCGLKLELDGDRIVSVRGDEDDPFSQGYVCPKGVHWSARARSDCTSRTSNPCVPVRSRAMKSPTPRCWYSGRMRLAF